MLGVASTSGNDMAKLSHEERTEVLLDVHGVMDCTPTTSSASGCSSRTLLVSKSLRLSSLTVSPTQLYVLVADQVYWSASMELLMKD